MTTKEPYELTFFDTTGWGRMPDYQRDHATIEDAADEARRVLSYIPNRAAHPAMIYGPDDVLVWVTQ